MTERIDIDRLARECDFDDLTIFRGYPPNGIVYKCTPEELTAYTRMVMEECAKACDAEASIEGIAQKCSAAIREMMP